MVAKKNRKGRRAAPKPNPKPKKRAGRTVEKKKARTKPKVRPAADDNTPLLPFRSSQPPSMHWGNSFEAAAQIATWQQTRNVALLSTIGAVEPVPVPQPDDLPISAIRAVGSSDPNALRAEMIERIEALEREIDGLREHERRGIGHNKPPEPIEPAPLSAKELGEIRKAMAVLKKQPPAPTPPSAKAKAAVALLMKFGAYLGKQADSFVNEAVKEAGKRAVQSPFWLALINQLPALADVAHRWLGSFAHL